MHIHHSQLHSSILPLGFSTWQNRLTIAYPLARCSILLPFKRVFLFVVQCLLIHFVSDVLSCKTLNFLPSLFTLLEVLLQLASYSLIEYEHLNQLACIFNTQLRSHLCLTLPYAAKYKQLQLRMSDIACLRLTQWLANPPSTQLDLIAFALLHISEFGFNLLLQLTEGITDLENVVLWGSQLASYLIM